VIWYWASAALMTITAAIHSKAGEDRLLKPLLAMNQGVMANGPSRRVLRSAWHLTSVFMISNALVVAWPEGDAGVKAMLGGLWLAIGLFSLIASRGRHVGWPWLSGAGVAALIGSWA
jgi:hypothetical protein